MKKCDPFKNVKLDPEEKEMFRLVEAGEWKSVKNKKKVLKEFRDAWEYTKAIKQQVNMRLSTQTVKKLKQKAMIEGIPYQTLIDSVLHKYVTGVFG
jgi:predicted DNA binding CopG/RHH family protein